MQNLSLTKKVLLSVIALGLVLILVTSGKLFEYVDNSEIVVIQSAFSGEMYTYTQPGPVLQMYGTATHYDKRNQFWFSSDVEEGDTSDRSFKIRFNDGGHAKISGSVSYYMPVDRTSILKLHSDFGSKENIQLQLIKQVIAKSVYMTGPLMSSKESSAEKRTDLLSYIEDQSMNGIYKTTQVVVKTLDPITNVEKSVTLVKTVETKGQVLRQDMSPIKTYNITLSNLTINDIAYDKQVEQQIKDQQQTTMMIQSAIANSKKAEQDAITAELQGKAQAAKAKWDQEVKKAQAVTEAQQAKEVAALQAQTAVLEAQKIRTESEAKAYANAKLVSAGLTPQERAEYEMKTKIGVAAEIGKITLPTTYISGSSGSSNNSMLESILGVKLLENKTK